MLKRSTMSIALRLEQRDATLRIEKLTALYGRKNRVFVRKYNQPANGNAINTCLIPAYFNYNGINSFGIRSNHTVHVVMLKGQ